MIKSLFFRFLNTLKSFNLSFLKKIKNNENKIKPYWKVIRTIIFCIFFLFCGLSILPIIVFILNGNFWLVGIIGTMFIVWILVDKIEYQLGWIDQYSRWIN